MILLEKRFLVLESLLTLFPLPFSELSGQDFCPRHSIGGFFSFFWAGFGMVLVPFIPPSPPPHPLSVGAGLGHRAAGHVL